MTTHISEQRRIDAERKISAKLAALEKYIESGKANFEVPKKFAFNWFCSFSGNGFAVISKSASDLRRGAKLRERVDQALVRCGEKLVSLSVDKRGDRISSLEDEVKELKTKCADLERKLAGQAADNADLIIEVDRLKAQFRVNQAQWAEKARVRELR